MSQHNEIKAGNQIILSKGLRHGLIIKDANGSYYVMLLAGNDIDGAEVVGPGKKYKTEKLARKFAETYIG